ncbi:hypothetical protein GWI33_005537 [Rhynchophorus ferrugineus]|uniref:Uncharacterized protein n=1 Tax=Rhynchophorus ferrugineus TaxID=354439 RepID=A0A834MHW8_RHYFE|nr:hypothetical protein GWI33_005537 [Rhynchophorus ferrugineus]
MSSARKLILITLLMMIWNIEFSKCEEQDEQHTRISREALPQLPGIPPMPPLNQADAILKAMQEALKLLQKIPKPGK